MSIRRIPERYLNTTLHIVRDISTIDEVGDAETVRQLAYGSIHANVQPFNPRNIGTEVKYEVQGRTHIQTHKAYFNRFEDGVKRTILSGDYAIDLETMKYYIVLASQEYQASNRYMSDTHHFKLVLSTADKTFDLEQSTTISARAKII